MVDVVARRGKGDVALKGGRLPFGVVGDRIAVDIGIEVVSDPVIVTIFVVTDTAELIVCKIGIGYVGQSVMIAVRRDSCTDDAVVVTVWNSEESFVRIGQTVTVAVQIEQVGDAVAVGVA